ncbi:MAG: hypothetical protein QXQ95_08775 [Thermofilum sp.]|uniref:hypothetical protein n=1 Tax=Thermofilum sp. TaxID=1961369 RepID=UPI003170E58A
MGELIHLYGETDGVNTTGTFTLNCDRFASGVNMILVPKGVKAKVWCKRISGSPVSVVIKYTSNAMSTPINWVTLSNEFLQSPGELILEKRRPIVILGSTGTEAIQVDWSQQTAAKSYVELEVELTED